MRMTYETGSLRRYYPDQVIGVAFRSSDLSVFRLSGLSARTVDVGPSGSCPLPARVGYSGSGSLTRPVGLYPE